MNIILKIPMVKCLGVKVHANKVLSNIIFKQPREGERKNDKAKIGQNVNNWYIEILCNTLSISL